MAVNALFIYLNHNTELCWKGCLCGSPLWLLTSRSLQS